MKISTAELLQATTVLLQHLESTGRKELDISEDYYWHVPMADRYNPCEEPKELTIGSLFEDWARVAEIARGQNEPLGYGFVWLSTILRRVGETNVE